MKRGGYPPGTSAGDPRAPWNDPEPPKCGACRNRIKASGPAAEEFHDEDCPNKWMGPQDIADAQQEAARKTYDDIKEEKMEKRRKEKKNDSTKY